MSRKVWTSLCELVGATMVVLGVANYSVPVAVILLGVGLIVLGGVSA
jgi:hypothetical protein